MQGNTLELPELGTGDLEKLLQPLPDDAGLGEFSAWLLDDSPANSDPLQGLAAPGSSPTGVAAMPSDLLFAADPFLSTASVPGLDPAAFPMPALGPEAFAPPGVGLYGSADSSGAGSGTASAGFGAVAGAALAPGVSSGAAADAAAAAAGGAKNGGKGGAKGQGGKKELTEEQKERIKAKNRRAQARYREKQKAKAAASEAEFNHTANELARLRLENSRLQEQQQAMEQVLSVRETMMGHLEDGKAAMEQEAAAAAAQGTAAQQIAARLTLCSSAGEDAGAGAGPGPGSEAAAGWQKKVLTGGSGKCPLTGLSLSQIAELKRTPPEELQRQWRSIVQRLALLLQQLEAARTSPDPSLAARAAGLEAEVEAALKEGQSFCFEHAVYQPTNVQRLFAAALDDGRSQIDAKDMRHWQGVADAIDLSEEQLGKLSAARTQFLARIAEVCAERREIFERLQGLEGEVPTTLRAMQHATAAWLKVHEATADLTANMNQEHCVCMGFVRDAFGYVLSPQQKAVAIVRAYPHFPDMYSVSTAALEAEHPATLALSLTAGGAGGGSGKMKAEGPQPGSSQLLAATTGLGMGMEAAAVAAGAGGA